MATATVSPVATAVRPIVRLLAGLRRRARAWVWVESLAWIALAAALLFWTTLGLDWLIEPPAWARATAALAAVAILAWLVVTRLVVRLATPLDDRSLALAVERTHPCFRDSLATAVGLTEDRSAAALDPELAVRTAAEAVALLPRVRPGLVFRQRRLMLLALAGVAAAASVAVLAAARPTVAELWARRMAAITDEPWPRRVRLDVEGFVAGRRVVARGSDAEVLVRARSAATLPEFVELRTRAAAGVRADRMGTRGAARDGVQLFAHVLKGVDEDLALEVRGGDARIRGLRLVVADAPTLAGVEIRCTPPAYLGTAPSVVPPARIVQVPRGSRVDITCTSSKPLAAATIATRPLASGDAAPTEQPIATLPEAAAGSRTIAATIPQLEADAGIVLRLVDSDGLANRDPVALVLSALPDDPPQPRLRLADISPQVTARARLTLEGTISDDHGLAAAEVRLVRGEREELVPLDRAGDGGTLVEYDARRPAIVPLEPLELSVGDRVAVTVVARDACGLAGGPQEARGDEWQLEVVAPEALQALLEAREVLLRRRYQAAIDDLAQCRDRLAAAAAGAEPARRCAEAATRAAGETGEIAAGFRSIQRELDANQLLTPEIETRLLGQIAVPLEALATVDLPGLAAACRTPPGGPPEEAVLARRLEDVLARMRAVLERMLELESFNEVIERLRGMIRLQEQIRADTLERQRSRGREALESP